MAKQDATYVEAYSPAVIGQSVVLVVDKHPHHVSGKVVRTTPVISIQDAHSFTTTRTRYTKAQ